MTSRESEVAAAAYALRSGNLVVVPTETVYGLAADALNPDAIQRIFEAKGRPAWNPLIVHVASLAEVEKLAFSPPTLEQLGHAFWPGPLTVVLHKRALVPDIVTAGLATVAIRVPRHPLFLDVLREFGGAVAAPSANLFTELSPTSADQLSDRIRASAALVLDGGACEVGIESTVLDLSEEQPAVLRQGMLTTDEISAVLGMAVGVASSGGERSPGQHPRHYAPRTPIRIVTQLGDAPGLGFGEPRISAQIQMPPTPKAYARELYAALYQLDQLDLKEIFVEAVPEAPEWEAIRDRLARAAWTAGG